jgi:hypothetical protein
MIAFFFRFRPAVQDADSTYDMSGSLVSWTRSGHADNDVIRLLDGGGIGRIRDQRSSFFQFLQSFFVYVVSF